MKKILLFALAAFTLQTAWAGGDDTVTLRIDDMHCRKCSNRIIEHVSKLEGVDSMAPSLARHFMQIRYDAQRTSLADIRNLITQIGYTPVNYYADGKKDWGYFLIPTEQATQETIDAVKAIKGVDDANVNARRKSLAVTFVKDETTAEQLLEAIQQKGIQAVLPKPHVCNEEGQNKQQ